MRDLIQIRIDGETPSPASYRMGGGRMFEGQEAKTWKQIVRGAARDAMGGSPPLEGSVGLAVTFYFVRAKAHRTRKGGISAEGKRHPEPDKKPDLTALLRAVEDALSGIVFHDDSQVCVQQTRKAYADRPGCEIEVVMRSPLGVG